MMHTYVNSKRKSILKCLDAVFLGYVKGADLPRFLQGLAYVALRAR